MIKCAQHNSKPCTIKVLVEHGLCVFQGDLHNNSLMHYAAIRGSIPVIDYLLSVGCNPYSINQSFHVPYEKAKDQDIIDYLKICAMCHKPGLEEFACKNCHIVYYCSVKCC